MAPIYCNLLLFFGTPCISIYIYIWSVPPPTPATDEAEANDPKNIGFSAPSKFYTF